jgi:uncharacterized protein (TIGR02301 family)
MIPKSVKRFLAFAKLASASEGRSEKIMLTKKAVLRTERTQRISFRSMLKRALTIALVALTVAATPVRAIEGGPAPFDSDLMRLAEILGALHYLRTLCGANEGNKWRDQMTALMDAEAQSGDRRSRLVANFNNGYRNFQRTYRTCTPAANLSVRRYLDEGAKISREITARYTN